MINAVTVDSADGSELSATFKWPEALFPATVSRSSPTPG